MENSVRFFGNAGLTSEKRQNLAIASDLRSGVRHAGSAEVETDMWPAKTSLARGGRYSFPGWKRFSLTEKRPFKRRLFTGITLSDAGGAEM